jgi:Flp pilus assembly pilin Flp
MKLFQRSGQGLIEYALIVLLVAIGALVVLQMMGISVSEVYCKVSSGLGAKACQQTSTAYCTDNFANMSGSQILTGTWTLSNNQLCNLNGGIIYNKCSMATLPSNDYTAQIDGAMLNSGPGYGIFFRATNTGAGTNGYAFQYDPGLGGFVVRKWVNGVEINPPIAKNFIAGYDYYSKPHTLSVKMVGNTFTGYVDGLAMLSGTDSTYASGGAGIRTWYGTNLCLNNFSVNPVTP